MRLLERLIEEATDYILRDDPLPVDLMVKLVNEGVIIEDLRNSVLTEYMHKGA